MYLLYLHDTVNTVCTVYCNALSCILFTRSHYKRKKNNRLLHGNRKLFWFHCSIIRFLKWRTLAKKTFYATLLYRAMRVSQKNGVKYVLLGATSTHCTALHCAWSHQGQVIDSWCVCLCRVCVCVGVCGCVGRERCLCVYVHRCLCVCIQIWVGRERRGGVCMFVNVCIDRCACVCVCVCDMLWIINDKCDFQLSNLLL